jgi:hypothetical protein
VGFRLAATASQPATQGSRAAAPQGSRGSPGPSKSPTPSKLDYATATGNVVGENAAGLLMAILAYALFINFIRGGTSGIGDWFKAKFLNQTPKPKSGSGGPLSGGTAPKGSTSGGGGGGAS